MMALVRANYRTRSPTTPQALRRAARYYTIREGPDRNVRQWYGADGEALDAAEVQAAVAQQARTATYSYRVVLSTEAADIGPAGYQAALAGHFERYYLVEHHHTAYPHAHVIGFREQRLDRADLVALRDRMATLEHTATRTLQVEQERPAAPHHARSADRTHDLGIGGGLE